MSSRSLRILSLVLVLVMLTGLFAGSQLMPRTIGDSLNITTNSITSLHTTAPGHLFTTGAASVQLPTPPVYTQPSFSKPFPTKPTLPTPIPTQPAPTQPPTTAPIPTPPPTTAPAPTQPPTTAPTPTQPPTTAPPPTTPDFSEVDIPKLSAKNAFVFDTRTEEFLYASCDTDKSLYPASITKLFSTYVALQYLGIDDKVTVGNELSYVAYDASVVGFQKGDVVSVKSLVYGALLPSGCDASYILAAAAGKVILDNKKASAKNAINAFLEECNRRAQKLGMENTNIANPDGYHASAHYISVQAICIIGQLSLENKHIAKAAATGTATITYTNSQGSKVSKTFTNTNKTILSGNKYYHPLSVGLKTGTTDTAGACLLAAYKVEDGYILIGIFGSNSNNSRFTDANALFDAFHPYL